MAQPPKNPSNSFKNPFSSGLGRTGRMGAWIAAIGIVAAWNYYENQNKNTTNFSSEEQAAWNEEKKRKGNAKSNSD
eukprot:CAMPEP_0171344460 /NCGR_PEP_ID=MMETSP0878-20121228/19428_1 /TAXON_ID=67004 /ORGANISM="Thalassiosira weissflogii, Strain CCMP1336" /LENGTH=75 /DNA_ID=CAMNT_0011847655 /DNA_START=76 /DNA_END=303 /DNA_ORIENTATION=-